MVGERAKVYMDVGGGHAVRALIPPGCEAGLRRCQRRIVEPLVRFGLLDERVLSASTEKWWRRRVEVCVAPLFDQFLTFHWE